MNTSIIILVCALIAIATAQKCVEDNVHAYVPSYKAFTNYIGDEGTYFFSSPVYFLLIALYCLFSWLIGCNNNI